MAQIDGIMAARGWMTLNLYTSKILVAERDGAIVGFNCIQLVPHLGPLYVAPELRGTALAADLSDKVIDYMAEAEARGYVVIASNRIVEEMCVERGMHRLAAPVYIKGGA